MKINKVSTIALTVLMAVPALLPSPLPAQSLRDKQRSELLDFIYGPNADPSCGVCLKAAAKYAEAQKNAALKKRTDGMVLVPAAAYTLGSPAGVGDPDEHPAGEIYLDAFFIDTHEVTLSEYMDFAKNSPANLPEWAVPNGKFNIDTGRDGYYKRLKALVKTCPKCAAFGMDWKQAAAYCAAQNKRLPTEAEWEAAARAGSEEPYSFTPESAAAAYAWIETNSGSIPHPVGRKKPNAWGMHDMHGNVWEWVADLYEKAYYASRPKRNPGPTAKGKTHVIRGGSWSGDADATRSGNRASAKQANDDIGFRCAAYEKDMLREERRSF